MYKQAIVVSATVLLLATGDANAEGNKEENGWYIGFDLGRSRLDVGSSDIDAALATQGINATTSLDGERSAATFDLFAGYRVNRNFGVELGLNHLGSFNYNAVVASTQTRVVQGTYNARAMSLSAVGILPLRANWSLYGKVGLAAVGAELAGDALIGSTSVSTTDHTSAGVLVGAGAMYAFDQRIFARFEFDEYPRVGNDNTGKASIGLLGLGLGYRF